MVSFSIYKQCMSYNIEKVEDNLDYEFKLKELFFSVKKNKLLIIIYTLIGLSFGFFYNKITTEIWGGEFQIVLDEKSNSNNSTFNSLLQNAGLNLNKNRELKTEVAILKSPSLLMDIYKFVEIDNKNNEFDYIPYSEWKKQLDINLQKDTSVLKIKYEDANKELILPVLKKISESYQNYAIEKEKKVLEYENKFYKDQIALYKDKSNLSIMEAQNFANEHDLIFNNNNNNEQNNSKSPTFTTAIETTRIINLNKVRVTNEFLEKLKNFEDKPDKLIFLSSSISSSEIKDTLKSQQPLIKVLNDINLKLIKYKKIYKDNDLIIKDLNEEKLILAKNLYMNIKGLLIAEKEKSEAIILSTNRPKGILVKFAQLNSEASRDANILFNLENQYRLIMLQKAKNNKPWELITKPTLDLEPKYPNKSRNKTFGALLGLFFGLSYSLFKQNKKNLIFSNKEIEELIQLNKIAEIYLTEDNSLKEYIELIFDKLLKSNTNSSIFLYSPSPISEENTKKIKSNIKDFKKIKFQTINNLIDASNYENIIVLVSLGITNKIELMQLKEKLALLDTAKIGYISIKDAFS